MNPTRSIVPVEFVPLGRTVWLIMPLLKRLSREC
jgi:hypothetical protein